MAFWDPHRSPAPAGPMGRGGARERREVFAVLGRKQSRAELCADEGGGSDVLKLDNALAAVDDFVSQKLGV